MPGGRWFGIPADVWIPIDINAAEPELLPGQRAERILPSIIGEEAVHPRLREIERFRNRNRRDVYRWIEQFLP